MHNEYSVISEQGWRQGMLTKYMGTEEKERFKEGMKDIGRLEKGKTEAYKQGEKYEEIN